MPSARHCYEDKRSSLKFSMYQGLKAGKGLAASFQKGGRGRIADNNEHKICDGKDLSYLESLELLRITTSALTECDATSLVICQTTLLIVSFS